jgi:ribosomal protein S12 methylthiotransferase accessory factor
VTPFAAGQHEPKRFVKGTHRTRSPKETLAAYRPLMQRLGITRLANVTGLDSIGIPVYMAIRPASRVLSVSQGKGLDKDAAAASALMESIELWHAERLALPMRFESHQALLRSREPVVMALDDLPRLPGDAPPRDRPLLWVRGQDLFSGEPIWVPEESIGANMVLPQGQRPIFLRGGNGLASGNHLLEATVHALSEAVERDAVTLWYLDDDADRTKATQLDLATVDDAACKACIERLRAAEVHCAAWDATSDLGIPAYVCTIFDEPGMHAVGAFSGYGAHLSPSIALLRALTEAVQSRLTQISGGRDDMLPSSYQRGRDEALLKAIHDEAFDPPPVLDFRQRQSLSTDSFEGDLAAILERLSKASLREAIAVDLSRPEVGVPVVKVVVPGLAAYHGHPHAPGSRERARAEAVSQ